MIEVTEAFKQMRELERSVQNDIPVPRVIVVDDEEFSAAVLCEALHDMGYQARSAYSGQEALDLLNEEAADILLTDIRMPVMDGLTLMSAAADLCPDLQTIVLTGYGDTDLVVESMRRGAIDFLQKPANLASIDLSMRRAAERWRLKCALDRSNEDLRQANTALTQSQEELETRVEERTAALQAEVRERRLAEEALAEQLKENALLLESLEQRVSERTRQLATLYDVSAITDQTLDLKEILDHSLDSLLAAVNSHRGFIHLIEGDMDHLQLYLYRDIPETVLREIQTFNRSDPAWKCIAEGKEPLVVHDLHKFHLSAYFSEWKDVAEFTCVAITTHGEALGMLSILGKRQYSQEDIKLIASVADQIGSAIESIRLREKAQQAAVIGERQRLARELHDSVTQSLYSLSLMAETGRRLLAAGDIEGTGDYLGQVFSASQEALREMRLLIFELRPLALIEGGLLDALHQRLYAVERRSGIETRLITNLSEDALGVLLSKQSTGEEVYRILQEALNNALKHAGANIVTLRIFLEEYDLVFEVCDNGRGFDKDQGSTSAGLGIVGMQERANRIGGVLDIQTSTGSGTTVRIRIKCSESQLAEIARPDLGE